MLKLRNPNDSVLDQYLYCIKKNNRPRVHHRICEERCKKFKKCPYYSFWYKEYYGRDMVEEKVKPKRKKVVKRKKISRKKKEAGALEI